MKTPAIDIAAASVAFHLLAIARRPGLALEPTPAPDLAHAHHDV